MPYWFIPTFNGTAVQSDQAALQRCESCGMTLNKYTCNWDMPNKPHRSPQISLAVEGFMIASPSFRARYEAEGWTGLSFRPLSNGYFEARAPRVVKLLHHVSYAAEDIPPWEQDPDPRVKEMVVFERSKNCGTCGQYNNSLGHGALVILRGELPVGETEFVCSDIALGSEDFMEPFVIAGDAIRASHKAKPFAKASVTTQVRYQSWS